MFGYRSSLFNIFLSISQGQEEIGKCISCRRNLDVIYFNRKEVIYAGDRAHKLPPVWGVLRNFRSSEVMFRSDSTGNNSWR